MIFLDAANDRYFCLPPSLGETFAEIVHDGNVDEATLAPLESAGVIVRGREGRDLAPCPSEIAPASLVEGLLGPAQAYYPGLLWALLSVKHRLRRQGLDSLLTELDQGRARNRPGADTSLEALRGIAHAFEQLALLTTTHDQCLPRSLALSLFLAARGFAPDLVFAVRLRPFKAHCWVECAGYIVNDQVERVGHYTPILRA